jgi:hypothetical protein
LRALPSATRAALMIRSTHGEQHAIAVGHPVITGIVVARSRSVIAWSRSRRPIRRTALAEKRRRTLAFGCGRSLAWSLRHRGAMYDQDGLTVA